MDTVLLAVVISALIVDIRVAVVGSLKLQPCNLSVEESVGSVYLPLTSNVPIILDVHLFIRDSVTDVPRCGRVTDTRIPKLYPALTENVESDVYRFVRGGRSVHDVVGYACVVIVFYYSLVSEA